MPLRWDRLVRHARKHRTANAPGALVAALEPRRLLAAVAWDGGGDGLRWGDNRNWSGDRAPTADDDVTITGVPGGVLVQWPGAAARSIVSDSNLIVDEQATLAVATTATLGATLEVRAAELAGGTWRKAPGSDGQILINRGALVGVTLDLPATANSSFVVRDALTLNDTLTIAGGSLEVFSQHDFLLAGTGTVRFTGPNAPGRLLNETRDPVSNTEQLLTIGAGITVEGALRGIGSGPVRNLGTISMAAAGQAADIYLLTNEGTVSVEGANVVTMEALDNRGTVSVVAGAPGRRAAFTADWRNTGTVSVTDATIELGGTFAADSLDGFRRLGAAPYHLVGTMDATGGFTVDATTGDLTTARSAVIRRGTLHVADGARLLSNGFGCTFEDLTLTGDITLHESWFARGRLTVQDTLAVGRPDGTGVGMLRFYGNVPHVLDGPGEIRLGPGGAAVSLDNSGNPAASLTIESGIEIYGTKGGVGPSDHLGGTIVNRGTIHASGPGGVFTINTGYRTPPSPVRFINEGTVSADPGAVMEIGGTWSSPGQLRFDGATVSLIGRFAAADLANFSRTGGAVDLQAEVDLTRGPLNLTDATGAIIMNHGTSLVGPGEVNGAGAGVLIGRGGALENVTLNAPLRIDPDGATEIRGFLNLNARASSAPLNSNYPTGAGFLGNPTAPPQSRPVINVGDNASLSCITVAAEVRLDRPGVDLPIDGGMRLNGTIRLRGDDVRLVAVGTQEWRFGDIVFESPTAASVLIRADGAGEGPDTFTMNSTVRGARGRIAAEPGSEGAVALVNHGRISADVAGGEIVVEAAPFTNGPVSGAVEATGDGTLRVLPVPTNYEPDTATLRGGTWNASAGGTLLLPQSVAVVVNAAQINLSGEGDAAGRFPAAAPLAVNDGTFSLSGGYDFAVASAGGGFANNGLLKLDAGSVLTVPGDFRHAAAATTQLTVGGPPAEARSARISAGGRAELAGTLAAAYGTLPVPAITDEYEVLSAAAVAGRFDTFVPPPSQPVRSLAPRYTPTAVVLASTPPRPPAPALVSTSDTGVSQFDGLTSDTTPTFSGTAPQAASVRVLVDGVAVAEAPVGDSGFFNATLPQLADGAHAVTVIPLDAAGDEGPASSAYPLRVDSAAPELTFTAYRPPGTPPALGTSAVVFRFNEPVTGLAPADVVVTDAATGEVRPDVVTTVQWDGITRTAAVVLRPDALPPGEYRATIAAGGLADEAGNVNGADLVAPFTYGTPAAVVGRYLMYHRSALDGNLPPGPTWDNAIATDKQPLLPGQAASFANVSSYHRGINAVVIDLTSFELVFTAANFVFKVGNGGDPAQWAAAPAPSGVLLRRFAGLNGSDRVTIMWPNGAIRNKWLQVTVLPTARTGLARSDVFYFGNLVGDTGGGGAPAVNALDVARTRADFLSRDPAALRRSDFNKDGVVNAVDLTLSRSNHRATLSAFTASSPAAATAGAVTAGAALGGRPGAPSRRGVWDRLSAAEA